MARKDKCMAVTLYELLPNSVVCVYEILRSSLQPKQPNFPQQSEQKENKERERKKKEN